MTTLIFQPKGALQNIQVGAADIVALLGVAHSAWGWVGSLSGVKNILDRARTFIPGTSQHPILNLSLPIPNGNYLILTFQGPVSWEDGTKAFGGDPVMQFVGATLCALAHECGPSAAVKLFMRCIAPTLWDREFIEIPGLKETVRLQLMDNIQAILNDGAIRGFTERFFQAAGDCGLTEGDKVWLKSYTQVEDDDMPLATEIELIGGFLCWVVKRGTVAQPYCTRSGMVARTALYLRSVGYSLDPLQSWNGVGSQPKVVRGVILVTGGTSETDPLQLNPGEFAESSRKSHYQHSTIGAMLVNAVQFPTLLAPETAQEQFRSAERALLSLIRPTWRTASDGSERVAVFFGTPDHSTPNRQRSQPSSYATALASIYFPLSAQLLAQCYEGIATDDIRRCAIENKSNSAAFEDLPEDLVLFRVVTAGIIIAVVSTLAGADYWSMTHASMINLDDESWLDNIARLLDKGLSSSLPMAQAVSLVASIHCAMDLSEFATSDTGVKVDTNIIGARTGIYAVIPSLFLNMSPGPEALGLVCVDQFVGNIPVHRDGWIRSGTTAALYFSGVREVPTTGFDLATRGSPAHALLGPPVPACPDIPLYVSLERVQHYSRPDVMLTGRVNGEVVGSVSIDEVLWVVCKSLEAVSECGKNCTQPTKVRNVKASEWVKGLVLDPKYPVCLQVDGDPAWRLLAAGQAGQCSGLLMFGCFQCAVKRIERSQQAHAGGGGSIVVAGSERVPK